MTWLIPLAVTLCAAAIAIAKAPPPEPSGGFAPDLTPLVWLFYAMVVVIVSLVAWLIWAVLS